MTVRSLVSLLATALLAALLVTVPSGTAQAAKSPARDFPHMPRQCATPQEKIPAKPTVCPLNAFDEGRSTVVLWGDSHSWMFIPALRQAARNQGVNLVAVMMGSCPPMDNQVKQSDQAPACFKSNALGIDLVRQLKAAGQPFRVVLAGSWQRYLHALRINDDESYVGVMAKAMRRGTPRLVRTLRSMGAKVDVIGQVATVPIKHRSCAQGNLPYACSLPRSQALPEYGATRRYLRTTFKPLLGSRSTINVNPFFCTSTVCKGKVGATRTWFDDLHISASMSTRLASYLAPTVEAIVEQPEPEQPGGGCTILGIPIPC